MGTFLYLKTALMPMTENMRNKKTFIHGAMTTDTTQYVGSQKSLSENNMVLLSTRASISENNHRFVRLPLDVQSIEPDSSNSNHKYPSSSEHFRLTLG
ncbi:hypothetical protein AFLA_008502 [Aspergillus flavus NRRL3357]|nr:hypothetical protein AFLA_008502 [Aspergillus flavus NRRL3357]